MARRVPLLAVLATMLAASTLLSPAGAQDGEKAASPRLRYLARKAGASRAWRLAVVGDGVIEATQPGRPAQRQTLGMDVAADYRTDGTPAEAKEADEVVTELTVERLKIIARQNGAVALDAEMALGEMKVGGRAQPLNPELEQMLKETFGKPAARLRMPPSAQAIARDDLRRPGSDGLGDLDLAEMHAMLMPALPADGKPVEIGRRWKATRTVPLEFELEKPLEIEIEYSLVEVRAGRAIIRMAGRYQGRDVRGQKDGRVLVMKTLTYDLMGRAEVDVAAGALHSAKLDLGIELEGTYEGDGVGLKMEMPTTYEVRLRTPEKKSGD